MGYERRHNAIVVTSFDRDLIEKAHAAAFRIFSTVSNMMMADRHSMVSEILTSPKNGRYTFLVGPDGSKEGWEESDAGDAARHALVQWLDEQRYEDKSSPFDWAEVQYGDEAHVTKIVAHSDEAARRGG